MKESRWPRVLHPDSYRIGVKLRQNNATKFIENTENIIKNGVSDLFLIDKIKTNQNLLRHGKITKKF